MNAFWVPLGQLAFGTARPRTLNQTFTAETDGFFVAVLSAAEANASRANLMVRVGPPGGASLTNNQTLGMASVHRYEGHDKWLRYNSVTVPIAKGCVYQAVLENVYSNVECTMYWVPLTQN